MITVEKLSKAEVRKAKATQLQETILAQVETLCESEQWKRYLDFAQAFHSYSFKNLLLILAQLPEATEVAGFRKWQSLGRQVRKGSKAIKIFGYSERKIKADDEEKEESDGTKKVPYFPMLSVFDISQTDETADWVDPDIAKELDGYDEGNIYEKTQHYLEELGWSVERSPLSEGINGYTKTDGSKRVVINNKLSNAMAAKTLLHEAAHVLLHSNEDHATYVEHRGLKECEAESTAYVVAGALGLDTTAYTIGYIAGWTRGDLEIVKATGENVLKTAHKIIEKITT